MKTSLILLLIAIILIAGYFIGYPLIAAAIFIIAFTVAFIVFIYTILVAPIISYIKTGKFKINL